MTALISGRRESTFRRLTLIRLHRGIMLIQGGAIGADFFLVVSHIEIHVRVIIRGRGADAHEFPRTNANAAQPWIIVEMRYD